MLLFNGALNFPVAQAPQGIDPRLRLEHQVVPSNGLVGLGVLLVGDPLAQLLFAGGAPPVLLAEGDGAGLAPQFGALGGVRLTVVEPLERLQLLGQLAGECCIGLAVAVVRPAQLGGPQSLLGAVARGDAFCNDSVSVRVYAFTEQGLHLRFCHYARDAQGLDAGPHPDAGWISRL